MSNGTNVTFSVATSGFNNPTYSLSDSFSGSSISNSDISSSGNFSWTPTSSDVGNHTILVTVSDTSGHSESVAETITVNSLPTVVVQSLSPSNVVSVGQNVTFNAVASGFSNPSYTLSDSFSGTTLSNSNINSSGNFSWTPNSNDVGTHTIIVYVTDSSGHSASLSEQLVVGQPEISVGAISPSSIVAAGTNLTFIVSSSGFSNPNFALSDGFSGTTISNSDINSSGDFNWTPASSDIGTHYITITASDGSGHSANTEVTISVDSPTSGQYSSSGISGCGPGDSFSVTTGASCSGLTSQSSSSYVFSNDLSLGSTGNDVTALQTLLARLNLFSLSPTGYFGSITQTAVENFQSAHGIDPIGLVGPLTRSALNAAETSGGTASVSNTSSTSGYQFSNTLDIGSTGADVTALQNRLTADGLYSGPVTGYYGSLTQTAVMAFQAKYSLDQVGIVGPQTRALLNDGD